MLSLRNFAPLLRPITLSFNSSHFREMGRDGFESKTKKQASFRLCNVSSRTTELLEIQADEASFRVVFIPGNPGVITFYKDFVESLYEKLEGFVSVTAVGHISHTKKGWENGNLFSLQDQIEHKVDFIQQELQNNGAPILLVGHSIGAYIALEIFKRIPEKVIYCIGLYPFIALNSQSRKQLAIRNIAKCRVVCVALSSIVGLLGYLPIRSLRFIFCQFIGKSWSNSAIEAGCSHLTKYHTMRNIFFMAMTEFEKFSETQDWTFMRDKQHQIAFLFGVDDHWGPLEMFEEICREVPQISLSMEREGHTHAFCCTEAGSSWVANHIAVLIANLTSTN